MGWCVTTTPQPSPNLVENYTTTYKSGIWFLRTIPYHSGTHRFSPPLYAMGEASANGRGSSSATAAEAATVSSVQTQRLRAKPCSVSLTPSYSSLWAVLLLLMSAMPPLLQPTCGEDPRTPCSLSSPYWCDGLAHCLCLGKLGDWHEAEEKKDRLPAYL